MGPWSHTQVITSLGFDVLHTHTTPSYKFHPNPYMTKNSPHPINLILDVVYKSGYVRTFVTDAAVVR